MKADLEKGNKGNAMREMKDQLVKLTQTKAQYEATLKQLNMNLKKLGDEIDKLNVQENSSQNSMNKVQNLKAEIEQIVETLDTVKRFKDEINVIQRYLEKNAFTKEKLFSLNSQLNQLELSHCRAKDELTSKELKRGEIASNIE